MVLPFSIPWHVSSPFPLPLLQSTLVGKMPQVRTSHLDFCEVTVATDGSCPQWGSPDTPISHSHDPAALDVLGDSFFCLSWFEEALLAACHRFPSLLPGFATPAVPLEEPGGPDSSQPVPPAPQIPWQGLPVSLLEHPPGWEAPSLELSRYRTHRTQRASKHRETSRYQPLPHFLTRAGSLGNTHNLCPPLLTFNTCHHLPPSLVLLPTGDGSCIPTPCSLV